MTLYLLSLCVCVCVVPGPVCTVYRALRRGGETEEPNPGGGVPGAGCGPDPAGTGHVHRVGGGHGGLAARQQDSPAHGESSCEIVSFKRLDHSHVS